MTPTIAPQIFEAVQVYFYEEGIFIKSTLNLIKYGITDPNYSIPITVVANNKFGFNIIHGLYMNSIYQVSFEDFVFNKATLMLSKNYNWAVFIPTTKFDPYDRREAIVSPLDDRHKECYTAYFLEDKRINLYQVYESSNLSFSYGLGVE